MFHKVLKLREAYSDILQYDKYIEDLIVNRKKEFIFNNTGIREIRERNLYNLGVLN